MDIVIDIQGYRASYGRFIAKEIAILSLKGELCEHLILKASKSLKFPDKFWNEYHWVTTRHHQVPWSVGNRNFQMVMNDLRLLILNTDRVYVRGSCKAEFMKKYTGKEVIDLNEEQDECPPFRKMGQPQKLCDYHATLNDLHKGKHIYCALAQAHQLRDWIIENSSTEEWFDNKP